MKCLIYTNNHSKLSVYEQHNFTAHYAKKQGYSIEYRMFDLQGDLLHEAVNKCMYGGIDVFLVYEKSVIGSVDDFLFYKIYLHKFNKILISCI